jgi:hypothetical protein
MRRMGHASLYRESNFIAPISFHWPQLLCISCTYEEYNDSITDAHRKRAHSIYQDTLCRHNGCGRENLPAIQGHNNDVFLNKHRRGSPYCDFIETTEYKRKQDGT